MRKNLLLIFLLLICISHHSAYADHFVLALAGEVQNLGAEFEKSGKYSLEALKKNQNVVEINLQVKEETQ